LLPAIEAAGSSLRSRCAGFSLLNVHSVLYTGRVKVLRPQSPSGEAILDAAEATFAEAGYHGATFSTICRQAGVSRGLPSYQFGTKEELYRQVVQRAADRLKNAVIEPIRECAAAASLGDVLTEMVGAYLDYLHTNRQVVRLLQWEMLDKPGGKRPYAPSSALFTELLKILESVLAKNGRSDIHAPALLGSVVALCFFPFTVNNRVPAFGDLTIAERKRNIVALLTHGLVKKRPGAPI
jgi:AcrR family transcriptional regulator